MKLATVISVASAASGALALAACSATRAGYESPDYRVESADGRFEIRTYPDMVLASTEMPASPDAPNRGFRRLFSYISGANDSGQKIAMTTPVFSTTAGGTTTMSFISPAEIPAGRVPDPDSENVRIETMPGGTFASYRFSGRWSQEAFDSAADRLVRWIGERGLLASGGPIVANYDPPFTPPPLRRNEVLVRIADP